MLFDNLYVCVTHIRRHIGKDILNILLIRRVNIERTSNVGLLDYHKLRQFKYLKQMCGLGTMDNQLKACNITTLDQFRELPNNFNNFKKRLPIESLKVDDYGKLFVPLLLL